MRLLALWATLIGFACSSNAQRPFTVDPDSTLREMKKTRVRDPLDQWQNAPGVGIRYAGGQQFNEIGLFGNYMWAYQDGRGRGLTAFGPELSLSAAFMENLTYRKGTVGLRVMHLFGGILGPCGAVTFDNISYRASLDDTRLTTHIGLTLLDFITVEYAKSGSLTETRFWDSDDLLVVRVGLNGAVITHLFRGVS